MTKEDLAASINQAATIVETFRTSVDSGIPHSIIKNAKGIAILHVVKGGMLISARSGSGVVVAKLPNGTWSAPSAIHTSGLGIGHQLGVEITDFVIVLNTDSALEAFSKGQNLSLGGNMSVAVGPLGRNAEVAATAKSFAPIYSYSHSKGLFAGMSIELSSIVEKTSLNSSVYGPGVSAATILSGAVPAPDFAAPLYNALNLAQQG
ncbi:DUF500-domain-containing protein [Rhizoclosmatium globosum]|uniref:DUF500-domain-containing protein n=1 Tax=Rhizoclosmatium globosum TaxID=329046 RepID=A0A1Y2CCE2_9FUNG|nr:DUF500-domain-containing protein [Rhizoclosmatium globosum]|eukprot:ORY43985.1 DUF500-domain-containing protein [Rhizoclosmatium globosum]